MAKATEMRRREIAASRERMREKIAALEAQAETAQDEIDAAQRRADDGEQAEDILHEIRYWFHDVLVLGKPMRDPRKILAMVEKGIGK